MLISFQIGNEFASVEALWSQFESVMGIPPDQQQQQQPQPTSSSNNNDNADSESVNSKPNVGDQQQDSTRSNVKGERKS